MDGLVGLVLATRASIIQQFAWRPFRLQRGPLFQGDKALKAIEKRVKDMAESVTAKSASSVTVQDLAALDRVPRCPFTNRRSAAKEKES